MDYLRKHQPLSGVNYGTSNHCTNTTQSLIPTTTSLPSLTTSGNEKKALLYHVHTLLLFTKSDIKVVMVPQSVFVLSAAYSTPATRTLVHPPRLALMLLWLWTHLLLENVANQRLPSSVREDASNKPWRPLPAGRITTQQCQALLRIGVPLFLILSWLLDSTGSGSVLQASAILMCMMWLYNDLEGDSAGPLQRGAVNGVGLACFGWGALGVLVPDLMDGESNFFDSVCQTVTGGSEVSATGKLQVWTVLIAVIVTTTVHAQDFSDLVGDRERGRQTMPILYGQAISRWSHAVACLSWSVLSLQLWRVAVGLYWVPTMAVALSMAGLVVLRSDPQSDKTVWHLWCLWMVVLFTLPLLRGST